MVIELDVVPDAAGFQVCRFIPFCTVNSGGAFPLVGDLEFIVIQSVVAHGFRQYVAVERFVVRHDLASRKSLSKLRENGVECLCLKRLDRFDIVHHDVAIPVFIVRRLDQRVEFVRDQAIFDGYDPNGAGALKMSGGGFKIYGGKGHGKSLDAQDRLLSLFEPKQLMKTYHLAFVFLIGFFSFGQKPKTPHNVKVTYERSSNGTLVEKQDKIVVFAHPEGSLITSEEILAGKAEIPHEKTSVNVAKSQITNFAYLRDDKLVRMVDSTSLDNQKWELTNETKKILGYNCKKAKTVISSNWVEIWYTTELGVYGGPSVLGQKLGLVLQTVRNGNYHVTAVKVEKKGSLPQPIVLNTNEFSVDAVTYRDALWKSRFVNIPIFKNQQVNFSDDTIADANTVRLQHGQVVMRKIKIPEIPSGSVAFLDVTEKSKGDAYDRTGLVFVVPADDASALIEDLKKGKKHLEIPTASKIGSVKSKNQPPHLELMRFFTPFGISQYNNIVKLKNKVWQDSVMYRQEITDVLPAISGKEVVIGINIGNYDKGGHQVSANITYHKEGVKSTAPDFALPLFNTENFIEKRRIDHNAALKTDKGYETTFVLSAPVKNARLRYITTGHGGWENGDEFLQKQNTILLNGQKIYAFVPWRTDCGSYRLSNPASGNFENGLSSSDYSRSNWCPGTTTNPVWIDLGDLQAGEHTISVKIPVGEPEGESTSSWTLSGVLTGYN